ncbi:MAG: hypothetical protein J6Y85_02410 [Alphaproteobacteria bacterium]|nr:hypothetical protein [Alphaproteobacteria bacterium]
MQNQDESGRSMIEMLGVLSIMGVIMYGAVAGINFGIDMYKINATYNEVEELAQSIVDLYSWAKSYEGLSPTPTKASKVICENDAYPTCNSSGDTMTNQWGGNVTVASIEDGANFEITYSGVPDVALERLKTETGFKTVCVDKDNTSCSGGGNNCLHFYSRGSSECNS